MASKGTRSANTMQEYLSGLLQDVAFMQSMPDADLEYLTNLQATILAKLRQPMEDAMQSAQQASGAPPMGSAAPPPDMGGMGSPMGGAPSMGSADMSGMPPGGMPPGMGAPQLPPGLRNGGSIPPVDELRRLVGA